jgi:hypothetical protein
VVAGEWLEGHHSGAGPTGPADPPSHVARCRSNIDTEAQIQMAEYVVDAVSSGFIDVLGKMAYHDPWSLGKADEERSSRRARARRSTPVALSVSGSRTKGFRHYLLTWCGAKRWRSPLADGSTCCYKTDLKNGVSGCGSGGYDPWEVWIERGEGQRMDVSGERLRTAQASPALESARASVQAAHRWMGGAVARVPPGGSGGPETAGCRGSSQARARGGAGGWRSLSW